MQGKNGSTKTRQTQQNHEFKYYAKHSIKIQKIELFGDLFFVNGNPFLHTKSENINYSSVQALTSRKMNEIARGIQLVKNRYEKRGFEIHTWHVDNEFDNDDINKQ